MSVRLAILFAFSLWLAPRALRAEERSSGPSIRWQAPAACPQQREVQARVRRLSGSAASAQSALQVEGTITAGEAAGYHLKLVMRSGELLGERHLNSRFCADLAGAAAVTVALLLRSEEPLREADLVGTGDAPSTSSEPLSAAASSAQQQEREAAKKDAAKPTQAVDGVLGARVLSARAERPWHFLLRAPFAAASLGPLPSPSWGAGVAAGASYKSFRLWLEGSKWLNQKVTSEEFPGYGASVERVTGLLRLSHVFGSATLEVAPCLVLAVEHISAVGTGVYVAPRSEHATWVAAGGGAQLRLHLQPWFSLAASVDAQIETSRPRIAIGGVGEVGRIAPAAVTVTFGPEWFL